MTTEPTTNKTRRTFPELRKISGHLAKRLDRMKAKADGDSRIYEQHKTMTGIAIALEIIGETQNACINEEALQAFSTYVDDAFKAIRDWIKELLDPDSDQGWDDLPF